MSRNNGPCSVAAGVALTAVFVFAIPAFCMTIYLMVRDGGNVRYIQGVPPLDGQIMNLAGPGVSVVPSIPGHSITFSNTGVLQNLAGAGISVSSPTGDSTISNTGVLSAIAGSGIATSSLTGDVTISNTGVLQINGRSPTAGNILLSAGNTGINVANGGASNEISVSNAGVLSNVAGAGVSVSGATGDVTIVNTGVLSAIAGTGISVSGATGNVMIGNTGVLDLTAGNAGITLSASTGSIIVTNAGILSVAVGNGLQVATVSGAATITHPLTEKTLIDDTDATSSVVDYDGLFNSTTQGVWAEAIMTNLDDGQGNVGGNEWHVPAAGIYSVNAHCMTPVNASYYERIHLALTLAATTADPTVDGYVPAGGRVTSSITSQMVAEAVSINALVHAGCVNCPVALGARLRLHALVDSTQVVAQFGLNCKLQVTRLV